VVAWCAATLSVLLAAVTFLPSAPLRVLAFVAGAVLVALLTPLYLRKATPITAVAITVGAAVVSTSTVIRLSGLSLAAGPSCSQMGGADKPSAWLFTTTAWCLAAGLLASGRLVVQGGRRNGFLSAGAYRVASAVPVIAFAGFLTVGACRVGGSRVLSVAHNLAAVAALGSFCLSMAALSLLTGVSRPLRVFSATAALACFTAWLPTGLRFLGLIEHSPITTQHMELLVFALTFIWLGWLAWEWGPTRVSSLELTAEQVVPADA
jgi:hypothetical protein